MLVEAATTDGHGNWPEDIDVGLGDPTGDMEILNDIDTAGVYNVSIAGLSIPAC